jgi:pimeloyl-ACP methyl ester carboxylesterase
MPVAIVNGARINYLQTGPQEDAGCEHLVMVHGLATNMAFWYLHYAPVLSEHYRVTLFDLRGHGRSEMSASGYDPHNLACDMQALLDHLGIERAHIVAHSFGGVVALNMACSDPGRVTSLVLADTHISAVRRMRGAARWAFGEEMQALLDSHGIALDTRDPYFGYRLLTEVARLQLKHADIPEPVVELIRPLLGTQGNRTATQWLRLMEQTRAGTEMMGDDGLTLERLRSLEFPILAMYGSRSQAWMTGKRLLDVWPHAEFRSVREAGHFFPLSRPAEVIGNCTRFWQGDFARIRAPRQGELHRSHFRSDRLFQSDGAWYCMTRESAQVGPFAMLEDARRFLAGYIAEMQAGYLDAVAQL